MTLGGRGEKFPYDGSLDAAKSFGAIVEEMDVHNVCTDFVNDLVTTPAYMQGDAKPHEVYDGIQHFVRKVNSLVKQNEVVNKAK